MDILTSQKISEFCQMKPTYSKYIYIYIYLIYFFLGRSWVEGNKGVIELFIGFPISEEKTIPRCYIYANNGPKKKKGQSRKKKKKMLITANVVGYP